jgi:hypothetical protein|tara:strand:+ start:1758 stop:2180 length:423 start_codon:yes stop_codon:yes gene_type:complete
MNAAEQARSLELAQLIASAVTLFRQRCPDARPNLRPWRDDPQTRRFAEGSSLDLAFHLPGWSPKWQCRSLLVQLRFPEGGLSGQRTPHLLGILISGMTFQGEQWRLATVGSWPISGQKPPTDAVVEDLRGFCSDLFELLP